MLVSRSGLSPEMVGRRAELAELRRLTELAAGEERPTLALVTAEAGVGKTRLLRELIATTPAGTVVLAGHADERDVDRPFSVVREAVQEEVHRWRDVPPALARFEHPLGHLLGPLLPLADHPADGHTHGADELLRTGVALVRHVVGAGPAIVAFDDLHWADAESMELFVRLATASSLPALVVGAFRPEEYRPDHPLGVTLDALARRQDVVQLRLASLTRSELRAFLGCVYGGSVAPDVVDALHDRTQGNPFFVEELLDAALRAEGGIDAWRDADVLSGATLPWTAAEAVRRRLERLPGEDRRVVEAAAVLGRQFSFALLSRVLALDDAGLVDACRRLVAEGVLVERGSDDFAFRHALMFEAVEQQLLALERRRIHVLALQALVDSGEADYGGLARHAIGAGVPDQAAAYLRVAAENALRHGAPRQALHFARTGVGIDPDDITTRAVGARAAADIGRVEEAVAHAVRWAVLAGTHGDRPAESAAHCLLAWLRWSAGDPDAAWSSVEAAVAAAEASRDEETRARALAVMAQMHMLSGSDRAAVDWADKAMAAAERAGARATKAHALVTKGTAIADLAAADDEAEIIPDARELIDAGRQEALAVGDTETLARALNNLLLLGQGLGSAREARALLAEARELADRFGLERFAAKLAAHDAYLGLVDGCRDHVEAALEEGKQWVSAPMDLVWCTTLEATLLLETGNVAGARTVLDAYWPTVAAMKNLEAHLDFAAAEAAVAAAAGDRPAAESALRRATEALPQLKALPGAVWWDVAIAALDAGVGPDLIDNLARSSGPPRLRRYAGAICHMEGVLHAAGGRRDDAVAALRTALEHPQGFRPATSVADIHVRLALLLAAAGHTTDALHHARAGVERLARWPGVRRDAATALLRRLEGGKEALEAVLTVREREVLRLVAEGLSNREIAERLVIARKTVATHVSNILAKTGLKSRTQAAAWGIEAGIVPLAGSAAGRRTRGG